MKAFARFAEYDYSCNVGRILFDDFCKASIPCCLVIKGVRQLTIVNFKSVF